MKSYLSVTKVLHSRPSAWLYLVPPVVILVLLLVDINPSGTRIVRNDMRRASPSISQFFPPQRLAGIENGRQKVNQWPIYFTVRYPHRYSTATVRVMTENPNGIPWKIGLQVGDSTDWSYFTQSPSPDGLVAFDLQDAAVASRSIRFMIVSSSPEPSPFYITGIEARLERSKLISWL